MHEVSSSGLSFRRVAGGRVELSCSRTWGRASLGAGAAPESGRFPVSGPTRFAPHLVPVSDFRSLLARTNKNNLPQSAPPALGTTNNTYRAGTVQPSSPPLVDTRSWLRHRCRIQLTPYSLGERRFSLSTRHLVIPGMCHWNRKLKDRVGIHVLPNDPNIFTQRGISTLRRPCPSAFAHTTHRRGLSSSFSSSPYYYYYSNYFYSVLPSPRSHECVVGNAPPYILVGTTKPAKSRITTTWYVVYNSPPIKVLHTIDTSSAK